MQTKTIKKVLKMKIQDWLNSVEDVALREVMAKDLIVTGGCIASMLLQEQVNDFDVYFKTKTTALAVAKYYASKFGKEFPDKNIYVLDGQAVQDWKLGKGKTPEFLADPTQVYSSDSEMPWWSRSDSLPVDRIKMIVRSSGQASDGSLESKYFEDEIDGVIDRNEIDGPIGVKEVDTEVNEQLGITPAIEEVKKKKYRAVYLSSNAITLSDKIQIIVRFYGTPEEIHKNFDFVHCTCWYEYNDDVLVTPKEALLAMMSKRLIYKGSLYPITSVIRTRKFIKRDWSIDAGQYLKMAMQISKLNLESIAVLEDQLVGVDSAFFSNIIATMAEKQKAGESYSLDYVASIVDKVFG